MTRCGDYDLLETIGRGAMGVVYRARDRRLDRIVALKTIAAGRLATAEDVERFEREARATARLDHPNIVEVLDYGEADGQRYYTMRLLEGDELSARKEAFANDPMAAVRVCEAIARAVHAAHLAGVMHRDLKPANIRFDSDGRPCILDFGLARVLVPCSESVNGVVASLTRSGELIGTPAYIAPEVTRDSKVTSSPSRDVYGVGAVLYELLTGTPPFSGGSALEILHAVANDPPRAPRSLCPAIPRDVETICLRCLEKNPNQRYETAAELADDLGRVIGGHPILARRSSVFERAVRWCGRNRAVATSAVASVFVLVAVLAAVALIQVRRSVALTESGERESEQADLAKRRLGEILRLGDSQRLVELRERARQLWPAHPDTASALQDWIDEAKALLSRAAVHRETLESVRTRAEDSDELQWQRDTLAKLIADLAELERRDLPEIRRRLDFARTIESRSIHEHADAWERVLAAVAFRGFRLTPQIGLVPIGPDPESGLEEFAHIETGEIPERDERGRLVLTEKTGVVFVLLPSGTFRMGSVRSSLGMLRDTLGLRPADVIIRVDDVNTSSMDEVRAAVASVNAGDEIRVTVERGDETLTLVGTVPANVGHSASRDTGPIHEVTLDPFFLSKFEMTQGQWVRATGTNPSYHAPGKVSGGRTVTLRHPVEMVNWYEVDDVFRRLGLVIPTEAQWEYAARGGTGTRWWTGNEETTLQGAANLADSSLTRAHGAVPGVAELDDGFVDHAPAGSHRANPFGLHDMLGNLREWCRDRYGSYSLPVSPGDGERLVVPRGGIARICRGSSFFDLPRFARSSHRGSRQPTYKSSTFGCRPARAITSTAGSSRTR